MKVSGTATLRAARDTVYGALQDPRVLVATIPGCQQLEATGADSYRMTVSAGVAAIKGTYVGEVRLRDQDPPNGYTLLASGQGGPGTVQAEARVRLAEAEGGGTLLSYDADAVVGGVIGGVGQRMLAGVARKTAAEFFAAVDRHLSAPAAAPGPPVPAPAGPAAPAAVAGPAPAGVFRAAAPVRNRPDLAVGAVLGAAIALVGVLVGARIGRARR